MRYRIFGENVNGVQELRLDKKVYRIGKSIIFVPGTLMAAGIKGTWDTHRKP